MSKLLTLQGIVLRFYTYEGVVRALEGVNLYLKKGETLGIVGETGCGKTMTGLSILSLIPPPGRIEGGKVVFEDGGKAVDLLKQNDATLRNIRGKDISMIFQEPSSALNPVYTIGDQVGEVIFLHRKQDMCKKVLDQIAAEQMEEVEKRKKKIEIKKAKIQKDIRDEEKKEREFERLNDGQIKPTTKKRIAEVEKKIDKRKKELERLEKLYEQVRPKKKRIRETEKKIYKRMLKNPNDLALRFFSKIPIAGRFGRLKKEVRKEVAIVLHDLEMADPNRLLDMYPHELSGGMQQRVVISMALACNPTVLIADEPTTSLDVTVQAQLLDLIRRLKKRMGTSVMYITHDLGVIAELCDRVAVMYAGNVCETAEVGELFKNPRHPYTRALLESIPQPGKEFKSIPGIVPSLVNPPLGCRFHPRCTFAKSICMEKIPQMKETKSEHFVSCHLY